jgi:hypothetical protein
VGAGQDVRLVANAYPRADGDWRVQVNVAALIDSGTFANVQPPVDVAVPLEIHGPQEVRTVADVLETGPAVQQRP